MKTTKTIKKYCLNCAKWVSAAFNFCPKCYPHGFKKTKMARPE